MCVNLRVCEWVNESDCPRGLIVSHFLPFKKVESASHSLWKFPTTPSWRITTKPSNSCWKRSTRGQSSSSPVRKTYGEERDTLWLHPCHSGALITGCVEVFNLRGAAPVDRLEAQADLPCVQDVSYTNTHTRLRGELEIQIATKQQSFCFIYQCPVGSVYVKKRTIKH